MSTCPRCYEDTGCTCEEHDRIKELEANLTKQAEVNCGLFNEVARLRGAFNLACAELEAYLGYCPIEQEKVPWDCDKKCTTQPTDCGVQCWGDWFKHKQALKEQA